MQVQTEVDNIAIENNDDRILHCCLLYQAKVVGHGGVVALFSNDTQLCSKAMINHVRALNRKVRFCVANTLHCLHGLQTLLKELRVLCRSMQQAAPTSYTHTTGVCVCAHVCVCDVSLLLAEFTDRVSQQVKREEDKILVLCVCVFAEACMHVCVCVQVDDLLCEGESILRESLAAVVSVEMELAFDTLWTTVVSVKPPWTLRDLLHILDKLVHSFL